MTRETSTSLGTRTETGQKVPHENPVELVSMTRSSSLASATSRFSSVGTVRPVRHPIKNMPVDDFNIGVNVRFAPVPISHFRMSDA